MNKAYDSISKKNFKAILGFGLIFLLMAASSCVKIDEFEKTEMIQGQKWYYKEVPSFTFSISDTTARYNVYITLRHTDQYNYNNIWLKLGVKSPADSTVYQNVNLILAEDAKGWEGSGMNDIFEVRKLISKGPVSFPRSGEYIFTIAQIMRENPLENIMNVGLRVEKAGTP